MEQDTLTGTDPAAVHAAETASDSGGPRQAAAAGGDAAGARADAAGAAAGTTANGDWRSALPEDLRPHADKFASPTDAVKAHREAQRQISRMISVPGDGASPEEIAKYRKAIGIPESPDGYRITIPDGLPDAIRPDDDASKAMQADFVGAMHAAGAPPAAVQAAVDWYYRTTAGVFEADVTAARDYRSATEESLRKEWGGDYDANMAVADRFVKAYSDGGPSLGGPSLGGRGLTDDSADLLALELKDGGVLGSHPAFVKLAARAGRALVEHRPDIGRSSEEIVDGEQRIDALTKQIADAHEKGDADSVKRLSAERDALAGKLYANGPLVGRDSRTL